MRSHAASPARAARYFGALMSSGRNCVSIIFVRSMSPVMRADPLLHLDDALHAVEMDLAGAPIGDALGVALGQVAHGVARDFRVMLKGLATMSPASSGLAIMNSTALRRARITARMKSPRVSAGCRRS